MTEEDFRARWRIERPLYAAWGEFVLEKIRQELAEVIAPVAFDYFLKIPPRPRLKQEEAFVDKAFHRSKPYKDPYADITDKVGMRFVVLLTSDISKVCSVIEGQSALWSSAKDRDYETERLAKPLEFTYQSVHYIVRAAADLEHERIKIPAGVPCEIQVRTLLQHAHSELTHDTLYKPKTSAQPEVKRTIAKSMALIEATDEFFAQAMEKLNMATAPQAAMLANVGEVYERMIGVAPGSERSNQLVVDTFSDRLPADLGRVVADFLEKNGFVVDRVKDRRACQKFCV